MGLAIEGCSRVTETGVDGIAHHCCAPPGRLKIVVNLVARRPQAKPVHEFLINRTTLGGAYVSGVVGSRLTSRWGLTLLDPGDWQERSDTDGDGWADLAGYFRRLVRPRFY